MWPQEKENISDYIPAKKDDVSDTLAKKIEAHPHYLAIRKKAQHSGGRIGAQAPLTAPLIALDSSI